ncbi:hypothetical protein ACFSTH_04390 [Paenibacillus yanchengensis]|uniref:DUF3939 domain-containing protein n=1 Tax=Paenibacillus yanchengensis TaxID=2035833 RepID=A0ABW4YJP3_9BACL
MSKNRRLAIQKKILPVALLSILIVVTLSGCLYPKERIEQQQGVSRDVVRNVQAVVDDYQAETGLLPILNSAKMVPRFEKFQMDFVKLKEKKYISEIPKAAFEVGGSYYFLIIDAETNPQVKLMHLPTIQKVNDLQNKVLEYWQKNKHLPQKEEQYAGFYVIDYEKLGMKAPAINSIFTNQSQELLVDKAGNVYVDYGPDIMQLILTQQISDDQLVGDLRELLLEHSDYVPVRAPAYLYQNNEPVAMLDRHMPKTE